MKLIKQLIEHKRHKAKVKARHKRLQHYKYERATNMLKNTYNNRTTTEVYCPNCGWKGLASNLMFIGDLFDAGHQWGEAFNIPLHDYIKFKNRGGQIRPYLYCPKCDIAISP